jgi:hypothetical protein
MAIVTPSYPPDFERCKLLVESLAHCAPQLRHFLIIDHRDRAMFRALENERTTIIESEDVLSTTFVRMPMPQGYWFNWRGFPVRGWIIQQILKIAAATVIDAETLVYVDSDVAFIRPFDDAALQIEGRPGLLDTGFPGGRTTEWTRVACRLLGLDADQVEPHGHVGNLICWQRANVLAMQRRIEDSRGIGWQQAIARQRTFSEYILYGCFVRAVLGYAEAGQRPSDVPLIKHSWGMDISTAPAVSDFFAAFDSRTLGVMAHSKDATDLAQMRIELERQWRKT